MYTYVCTQSYIAVHELYCGDGGPRLPGLRPAP